MSLQKPRHVFIVDDNETYAMMLDYFLSRDNVYKFVSFASGEECIKNLYLNPEIIILDYALPGGMDGYETLLEIKKINPGIHVIILTSNDDEELKQKLLKAGADDLILKQDHGETHIMEKIEDILKREELENITNSKIKTALMYVLLVAILLAFAFYTNQ